MAGKFSKKRSAAQSSWLFGLVLIALLLAAVFFGARWVLRASKALREKAPAAENASASASPTPETSAPEASEPETMQAPETDTNTQPQPDTQTQSLPEAPSSEASRVTLMALGDNLIHNTVYWSAETPDGGYDFTPFYAAIAPVVQQYDIACINQETILVDDPALYANYPNFGSPTQVADALADTGFSVVTGATNHCFDKGETGILDTCRYWREHHPDITTLGIHDSQPDAQTLRVVEKNGIRLAFLNYTYGLNGGAPQKSWMIDRFGSFDAVKDDLARAKEAADFVIVFAHWGEENTFRPNEYEKNWAQVLADGGADLIIGGHPHVVQPAHILMADGGREVPVFYSLGNFLSHQTKPQNMLGGMASVTICKDDTGTFVEHYELLPTVNLITKNPENGWYHYLPMLLSDYTPELAASHHIAGCSVEDMQTLFEKIISGTAG